MRWRMSWSWPSWYRLPTPRISTACSDEVGKPHLHVGEDVPAEEHEPDRPGGGADERHGLHRSGEEAPAGDLNHPGQGVERHERDDVRGLPDGRGAGRR